MLPMVIDCCSIHSSSVKTPQPDLAAFFFFLFHTLTRWFQVPATNSMYSIIKELFPTLPWIVCQIALLQLIHLASHTSLTPLLTSCSVSGLQLQTLKSPGLEWCGGLLKEKTIETRSPYSANNFLYHSAQRKLKKRKKYVASPCL